MKKINEMNLTVKKINNRQQWTMLIALSSLVEVTSGMDDYTDNKIHREIPVLKRTMNKIIDEYNSSGRVKAINWSNKIIGDWSNYLVKQQPSWNSYILVDLSLKILIDLNNHLDDDYNLNLLKPLNESLVIISNIIDPDGKQLDVFYKSDELLEKLYELIKFKK